MKAFFKRCYPNLEEQLRSPSFGQRREEVWQQLYDWNLPLDYAYFLIHTAGEVPRRPSLDLSKVVPLLEYRHRHLFITVHTFYSFEDLTRDWHNPELEPHLREDSEYCPIACLDDEELLCIGLNKNPALAGSIFYNSDRWGTLKIADNLLDLLQKGTKRTPWNSHQLKQLAKDNAIEQGQIQLSNFEDYPATKYYPEILLIQQHQGVLEYILTRTSIVLLGDTTREYWLEELESVQVDRVNYMQLAMKKENQVPMQLDFGSTQEKITLYDIQEYRALKKILGFVINCKNR